MDRHKQLLQDIITNLSVQAHINLNQGDFTTCFDFYVIIVNESIIVNIRRQQNFKNNKFHKNIFNRYDDK